MGGQCPRLGSWRIQWGCADELSVPLADGGRLSSGDPQTSEAFGYIAAVSNTLTQAWRGAVR